MAKSLSRWFSTQATRLAERGRVPDRWTRWGIRRQLTRRLSEVDPRSSEARERKLHEFLEETKNAPVAPVPEKANDQHYELPPEFFELCLGEYRKYSCCYWSDGAQTLSEAERRALEITCERARLEDGQRILELGCGWGSLSLFMAERYPDSRITAVSNSAPQRESILERARQRGLSNLRVITCDMNDFDPKDFGVEEPFDRAVSIEMFEHMRNWHELLRRIRSWLQPEGLLFVHIFVHAHVPYVYESKGEEDWMGHYFFTGGIMPSADQLAHYGETMELLEAVALERPALREDRERVATRARCARKDDALQILESLLRPRTSRPRLGCERWRIFYMACAELWGYRGGEEWLVGHYLLRPRQ
jgi:cyclopropane-fatty-acyl-phospholipid synthase